MKEFIKNLTLGFGVIFAVVLFGCLFSVFMWFKIFVGISVLVAFTWAIGWTIRNNSSTGSGGA